MKVFYFFIFLVVIFAIGCSGSHGGDGVQPCATEKPATADSINSHTNWGLWQFIADIDAKTLDVIMLRTGAMHLNALPFVDQPPLVYLTLESVKFSGNVIDVDIGLRHPFLGLVQFTGFDVKGTLITNGSFNGFTDSSLIMAADGDTRLLNADGLTRWWNPSEFPQDGTIFGYYDGTLGTPDEFADYNSTLNGYKYFCDDLAGPDDPLSGIDPEGRGVFSPGQKNVRNYSIEIGNGGLIFNYAVDASWKFPAGSPPWEAPDDFIEEANQPEAYRIEVSELDKTLYYDEVELEGGGGVSLSIDVYDWFGAELHTVKAEWPGFAGQVISFGPAGGGVGYSTYEIDLIECMPSAVGMQPLFITVESEILGYGDIIPDEPVSAYFIYDIDVPPGTGTLDPVDICSGWGDETGYYHDSFGGASYWFLRPNLASDSNGNVWMWCQRTSNAISRCSTPFNGDWNLMYEQSSLGSYQVFSGYTVDVSLTPTYDGGMIAGCSPPVYSTNMLSIAWWDGTSWHEQSSGAWMLYYVTDTTKIAYRINGYRDSTGRFHAFIQANNTLIDYYGDTWQGAWSQTNVAAMPAGAGDYACQTRTDFVSESSDGWIYLCWVESGIKVARCEAGTTDWNVIFTNSDTGYDSPTIYIDSQDRVFLTSRYFISNTHDEIHVFRSTNGTTFSSPEVIFTESGSRIDPCYLSLKGDSNDNLFLLFSYRPDPGGARIAIIAGNPGGTLWTDICVLSGPIAQHPVLAVRPDGSIEMCYADPTSSYENPDRGSIDDPGYCRDYIMGRSHPGFVN